MSQYTRRQLAEELGVSYGMLRWYERAVGDLVTPTAPGGRWKRALLYSEKDREVLQRAVRAHKVARVPYKRLRLHLTSGGDTLEKLDRVESMLVRVLEVVEAQEERYQRLRKELDARKGGG